MRIVDGRAMKWWRWILLTVLSASGTNAQTVLLKPPAMPVKPGEPATVDVNFLNDGTAPLSHDPPAELTARLTWSGGAADVSLARVDSPDAPPATRDVAVGGFVRVPYRVTIPENASGDVTLAIPGGAAAVLTVAVAATDAKPELMETPGAPSTPARPDDITDTKSATARPEIVEYFANHFSAHEPMYFVIGADEPNAKFQFSFKYRIFDETGSVARAVPPLGGLHFAYSQTSFWDLESSSSPFFDNSYRPELLFSYADVLPTLGAGDDGFGWLEKLGLQFGVQHESNGQDGLDSRSMNFVYVRPTFTFGAPEDDVENHGLFLTVAPRLHAYIGSDGDNPDIEEYRGYGDLRLVFGQRGGLQLAAIGRLGSDFDKGSLQLDLTYPLRPLLQNNVDMFLHAQFFTGYGESLLLYDESDTSFRIGLSLIR